MSVNVCQCVCYINVELKSPRLEADIWPFTMISVSIRVCVCVHVHTCVFSVKHRRKVWPFPGLNIKVNRRTDLQWWSFVIRIYFSSDLWRAANVLYRFPPFPPWPSLKCQTKSTAGKYPALIKKEFMKTMMAIGEYWNMPTDSREWHSMKLTLAGPVRTHTCPWHQRCYRTSAHLAGQGTQMAWQHSPEK